MTSGRKTTPTTIETAIRRRWPGRSVIRNERSSSQTTCPGQELAAVGRGERPTEQETLHPVALACRQELELGLRLHALRHHAQLQGVGEGDDRGGDGGVV